MILLSRTGSWRARASALTHGTEVDTVPLSEDPDGVRQGGAVDASEPQPRSLRAGFSWTLAGNLVYSASQWGMLTVIAKAGSPAMVGQFALAFAITAPVFMFANLNLAAVQSTDATGEYRFADYYTLRLITTTAALVLLIGVAVVGNYPTDTRLVILIVTVAKAAEATSDIFLGLFQRHERMDVFGTSLLIKGPSSLLAVAIAMYLSHRVVWSTVGLLVVWVSVLLLFDRPRAARILAARDRRVSPGGSGVVPNDGSRVRVAPATLRQLTRLALPMGFVAFANSLIPSTPRYFVERHLGLAALGVFAAMAYVYIAGQTVASALANSARPRLAAYFARGDREAFKRLTVRLVCLGAGIGATAIIGALVAGRRILTLLYAPEYAEHANVFTILMVAAAFSYVGYFLWNSATATRRFDSQVPLFATAVAVTLVACAVLVPTLGLVGAALAVLASALVQSVGSLLILVRALRHSDTERRRREPTWSEQRPSDRS